MYMHIMVHALFLTNNYKILTSQKFPAIVYTVLSTLMLCLFLLTQKIFQNATNNAQSMHIKKC